MANSETSKSAKARAGSGQRSRSGAKSRRKQRKDPARGAALGAAGLMFVLLAFVPGHSLWAGLRSAMFGIFGASLYLIGAVLLALAWQCFQGGRGVMYVQAVLFLPLFCGLPAALAGTDYTGMNVLEVVADSYKAATQGGWHGGVMGVVLGASLTTFCGQVVALILILIALALLIYFSFPISMAYLAQLARSAMESGKEHITDTRERREEAVRRSEELQRQNDERRAARKEREAALAARRTAFNIDVDLGPDPVQSRLAEAPAQPKPIQQPVQQEPPRIVPNFSDIVAGPRKTVTEAGNAAHSFAPPAQPAAPAMPEAEQPVQGMPVAQSQHIEVGPGGTFGLNPLREALSHRWRPKVPIEPPKVQDMHGEPDISAELGGEFEIPLPVEPQTQALEQAEAEAEAPAISDSELWEQLGSPDKIMAEVPAQPEPVPAPEPAPVQPNEAPAPVQPEAPVFDESTAPAGGVEHLIHKATVNGSMSSQPEATLEQGTSYTYDFPPLELLEQQRETDDSQAAAEMRKNADILVNSLDSFGVKTRILDICRGPSVTRYELQPQAGVKISRITSLADDIALNLAKAGVRIEAPIPGKPAVGIEVPNDTKTSVSIRGIFESQNYANATSPLTLALGKDIAGTAMVADLCKMPHLLIAGSTGSGKSVCVNSIIISFLYRSSPEDVRLILIDPKVVELAEYNGIPHLLMPVVTEPRKAAGALGSAVAEMERRYHLFAESNVRDIKTYNKMAAVTPGVEKLPYIAIIIDELADLMMVSGKEVEDYICRIAQKARAAGMHLIVATQRPSVDVITGLIKANIPSRIAFAVSSQVDSRTILDTAGAEKLLGMGDMLFLPVGAPKPTRIQGTYVKDEEITAVLDFIKKSSTSQYDEAMMANTERIAAQELGGKNSGGDSDGGSEHDSMFEQAVEAVIDMGQASTSMLQRRCKLGYARAARIMDEMEQEGIIGPYEGAKPRPVLINRQQWIERKMAQDTPTPPAPMD